MEIKENVRIEDVPKEVRMVGGVLLAAGYEAYLVGGCVRDLFTGNAPKDYDITTNATPEQIISLFPKTFYENSFGTVGVVTCGEELGSVCSNESVKIVEVTPFRKEGKYLDGRHPEKVEWANSVEDDLSRRDFTCNALALNMATSRLIDRYCGLEDLKNGLLRAVRDPDERFQEDGLRLLRAVRFAAQLDLELDIVTRESVIRNADMLRRISSERVRDEFSKLLMTDNPMKGLVLLEQVGLLKYIVPELERGIGVTQNQAHKYDVWEHNLRTLQHAADKGWPLLIRLAALFHDVSKPETKRFSREKGIITFYGHDVVGGRVTREILTRLKYPKEIIEDVSLLVRWHMFFSDTEQISLSAVRRMISNVGEDMIWELMNLRICDRVGTGRPKEEPYRFRKYQAMVEQALKDPISLKMLKIDGKGIMDVTQETPGPKIGYILHALFQEVIEEPMKNTEEYLRERALHMKSYPLEELKTLAEKGREEMTEKNEELIKDIQKKFRVS